jgi:predicted GNAT family acetyltransferase
MTVTIEHRPEHSRFQAVVDGHLCVADYAMSPGVMHITHTGVHPSLRGRGIAALLIDAAFAHARLHALKIDPVCSYVRTYIQRHPDTRALVAAP